MYHLLHCLPRQLCPWPHIAAVQSMQFAGMMTDPCLLRSNIHINIHCKRPKRPYPKACSHAVPAVLPGSSSLTLQHVHQHTCYADTPHAIVPRFLSACNTAARPRHRELPKPKHTHSSSRRPSQESNGAGPTCGARPPPTAPPPPPQPKSFRPGSACPRARSAPSSAAQAAAAPAPRRPTRATRRTPRPSCCAC